MTDPVDVAELRRLLEAAERERDEAVALGKRAARVLIGLGSDAEGARGDALALLPELQAAGWMP